MDSFKRELEKIWNAILPGRGLEIVYFDGEKYKRTKFFILRKDYKGFLAGTKNSDKIVSIPKIFFIIEQYRYQLKLPYQIIDNNHIYFGRCVDFSKEDIRKKPRKSVILPAYVNEYKWQLDLYFRKIKKGVIRNLSLTGALVILKEPLDDDYVFLKFVSPILNKGIDFIDAVVMRKEMRKDIGEYWFGVKFLTATRKDKLVISEIIEEK